jgi:putative phosphoribosyl transferase
MMRFKHRKDAGIRLARLLTKYRRQKDALVLALPRGGVPVAFEIARELSLPLDVFLVRKIGLPEQPELAIGAIASGGTTFLNQPLIERFNVSGEDLRESIQRETIELERRERIYRRSAQPPSFFDETVILVDDGLATGASMLVAVRALRKLGCRKIVIAVPVGAAETCESFRSIVDDVVCACIPSNLDAVGRWYENFAQTTDEEVIGLLRSAGLGRSVRSDGRG